jgi:hypothetical protein
MFFDTSAELLAEVEDILGDINIIECVNMFNEWKDYLKRCIDADGKYFENDSFDVDFSFATKNYRAPRLSTTPVSFCYKKSAANRIIQAASLSFERLCPSESLLE